MEWLDITPDEQREMRTLIGGEEKRRRDRVAQEEWRREHGSMPREDYLATHRDNTERPWELLGMSRATWYRKGKPRLNDTE